MTEGVSTTTSAARERLLATASSLFYREGIHTVGIDRILAEAQVTRATMYRHFPGKEDLVEAYLSREDSIIRGYFRDAASETIKKSELLRLVIEFIAEDISKYHTRGCPFINAAAEYPDASGRVRAVISSHRNWFRQALSEAAEASGAERPAEVAATLILLRDAALVGGYLDGVEQTKAAFVDTALKLIGNGPIEELPERH
ncbi:TetR/AcrR family transcriptional regulator [Psychromicrobium sp. YIM B11713]|uniref:TetR/AcrR family transcriptional regulator n=1 Tax=Psychromicrobium sp. YIM B11713 TaxID=3145233 RepID=UPI00374FCE61